MFHHIKYIIYDIKMQVFFTLISFICNYDIIYGINVKSFLKYSNNSTGVVLAPIPDRFRLASQTCPNSHPTSHVSRLDVAVDRGLSTVDFTSIPHHAIIAIW